MKERPWWLSRFVLYRPTMRLLHRFGLHWHKATHPMSGPAFGWCHWCGDRKPLGEKEEGE